MRNFVLGLLMLLSCWQLRAAEPASTFDVPLKNGLNMQVEVCTDRIFRVKIAPQAAYPESLLERYGVLKTDWAPVQVTRRNEGQHTVLTTPACRLTVNRANGEISLRDAAGKTLVKKLAFAPAGDPLGERLGRSLNEQFGPHRNSDGIIGDTTRGEIARFENLEVSDYDRNSVLSIDLNPDERFYGGGSTSRDHIQHRGEVLRMWTTIQKTEAPMPFMMSSEGWGIFNNTTRKNFFDVGRYDPDKLMIYNLCDGADFYLMAGESMPDVLNLYTSITGRSYLLPKWAYGLAFGGHMMEDQMELMDDALRFRSEDVPCDLLWLEPQWMSKYYDYSTQKNWDYKKFPGESYWEEGKLPKYENNALFISRLHKLGYKVALWLCIDHDMTVAQEDYLAEKAGKPASGQEHWFDHLMNFVDQGIDGFKLDPARTLDEHPDRAYYNGYTDREMHNMNQVLLPMQMNRTFREHKGIRSFHHYCGGYAGSQHWGALQSGDNGGGRTALFDQLNLGMSGLMNTSCDVMWDENQLASLHMGVLLPWTQINSWFTLFHPWYFPPKEKQIYRDYVKLRYALLPYIYSTAVQGSATGMPMVRSMPLAFPDDRNVDDLVYQYMLGDNLLVGVFSDSIYLPKGEWINFWDGKTVTGRAEKVHVPVPDNRAGLLFVKEGAIIPFQKPVQYIDPAKPLDTLLLQVYPKGNSTFTLYEDDGVTFKHEQGAIAKTRFDCSQTGSGIELIVRPVEGSYDGMPASRVYECTVACSSRPAQVRVDGKPMEGWSYEDGKLHVTLVQPDVARQAVLSVR